MSDAVKDRLRIAFYVGIVLAIFIFLGLMRDVRTVQLSAEDGVVDLGSADFSGRVYAINGGWRHYPGELRPPESMPQDADHSDAPGARYGSYYLRISVPDNERYTLNMISIDYATRVFINGELMDDIGMVAERREDSSPRTDRPYYHVYPVDGQVELALHYANHWHVRGGDSTIVTIGAPRIMAQRQARRVGYTSLLMGYLLTASALFFGFYVTQPAVKGHLLFAMLCLLILVRQGLTGDQVFHTMFPGLTWRVLFAVEYLDICLLALVMVNYLNALFPGLLQRPVYLAVHAVTASYMLTIVALDTLTYTYLLAFYLAFMAAVIVYTTVRMALTLRNPLIEQMLSVAGMVVFLVVTLWEMASYVIMPISMRPAFPMMPTAMVMFVLTQGNSMFILLRRRIHEVHMRVAVAEARYEEAIRVQAEKPQVLLSDFGLARREEQVAYLLIDGKSRAEIAGALDISLGTVNTYCSRIYQKLGVTGRDDLMRLLLTKKT